MVNGAVQSVNCKTGHELLVSYMWVKCRKLKWLNMPAQGVLEDIQPECKINERNRLSMIKSCTREPEEL